MSRKRQRTEAFHPPAGDTYEDPPEDDTHVENLKRIFGQKLYEYLKNLYGAGQLEALQVCTIAYFATMGGVFGCEEFSQDPGMSDGKNAARLLKFALHKEDSLSDTVKIHSPIYDRKKMQRLSFPVPVRLPTDILAAKYQYTPETLGEDLLVKERTLDSPSYTDHIVVRNYRNRIHWSKIAPISLFFDGVSYNKRDSFYGFYIKDARSGEEDLCFAIRALVLTCFSS